MGLGGGQRYLGGFPHCLGRLSALASLWPAPPAVTTAASPTGWSGRSSSWAGLAGNPETRQLAAGGGVRHPTTPSHISVGPSFRSNLSLWIAMVGWGDTPSYQASRPALSAVFNAPGQPNACHRFSAASFMLQVARVGPGTLSRGQGFNTHPTDTPKFSSLFFFHHPNSNTYI